MSRKIICGVFEKHSGCGVRRLLSPLREKMGAGVASLFVLLLENIAFWQHNSRKGHGWKKHYGKKAPLEYLKKRK